jgi:hypothetical protein
MSPIVSDEKDPDCCRNGKGLSDEVSAIEIARKQRHIYLLGKVRQNLALSRSEIEELKGYEASMPRKAESPAAGSSGSVPLRRRLRRGKDGLPIRPADVQALAFHHEFLVDASQAAGIEPPLTDLLDRHPVLAQAWERGEFLRRLRDLTANGANVPEIAQKLKIDPKALSNMISTDREVRQLWKQTHIQIAVDLKAALLEKIRSGDIPTNKITTIENILRSDIAQDSGPPGLDVEHVPIHLASQIVDVSRQALHAWHRDKGLPRNSDNTYDLRVLVPWVIRWEQSKALTARGCEVVPDLQRHQKGLKILDERMERKGFVIDTREVLKGILSRLQALLDSQRHHGEDLARKMEGLSHEQRVLLIREFFDAQRRQWLQLPGQLTLAPGGAELLEQLMTMLEPSEEVAGGPPAGNDV